MHAKKSLLALNDSVSVQIDKERSATVGFEYGTVGDDGVTAATGTVVIEGRVHDAGAWYVLQINKNDDTKVALAAAPVIGWVGASGWDEVRARMSVIGGAHGVRVDLNSRYA